MNHKGHKEHKEGSEGGETAQITTRKLEKRDSLIKDFSNSLTKPPTKRLNKSANQTTE